MSLALNRLIITLFSLNLKFKINNFERVFDTNCATIQSETLTVFHNNAMLYLRVHQQIMINLNPLQMSAWHYGSGFKIPFPCWFVPRRLSSPLWTPAAPRRAPVTPCRAPAAPYIFLPPPSPKPRFFLRSRDFA